MCWRCSDPTGPETAPETTAAAIRRNRFILNRRLCRTTNEPVGGTTWWYETGDIIRHILADHQNKLVSHSHLLSPTALPLPGYKVQLILHGIVKYSLFTQPFLCGVSAQPSSLKSSWALPLPNQQRQLLSPNYMMHYNDDERYSLINMQNKLEL